MSRFPSPVKTPSASSRTSPVFEAAMTAVCIVGKSPEPSGSTSPSRNFQKSVNPGAVSPQCSQPPFDMEREKLEPTAGDPSYRKIPRGTTGADVDVNHLHINGDFIKADINVMLPLQRMEELEKEGVVGELAPTSYSFYGFQWESDAFLDEAIRPMGELMKSEQVDAVVLTPA